MASLRGFGRGLLNVGRSVPVVGDIIRGAEAGQHQLDTSGLDESRRRAAAFYDQTMAERGGISTPFRDVNNVRVDAPTINTADADAIRSRQLTALSGLEGAAAGTAPSVAQAAYQGAGQDIAQQQLGMAGQARGTAGVFARREAMRNIGDQQRRAALDMAQIRAGEMAQARGQLAGALSNVRGADTETAFERARQEYAARAKTADIQHGAERANQDADIQSQQVTNTYKLGLGSQALDANKQQGAANKDAEELEESRRKTDLGRSDNAFKSAAKGAAALFAMSDEGSKRDIKPQSASAVEAFLRSVDPKSFSYKGDGPGTAPGPRVGVIAQDIDDTKLGQSFVVPTEHGKMLDAGQAVGPLLVIAKHLNDKIEAVAGKRRKAASEMRAA